MPQFRISKKKKRRQSRVRRCAGNFRSENMPAISGRKKMSANSGRKKMPVISDRNKMSANSSRRKCGQVWADKNAGVFGREKIAS